MNEIMWMVSFKINEDGSLSDYHIDQIDLNAYPPAVAEKLKAQLGKGLFEDQDEAKTWAKAQTGRKSCGCSCGKGGGGCGCPHKKGGH